MSDSEKRLNKEGLLEHLNIQWREYIDDLFHLRPGEKYVYLADRSYKSTQALLACICAYWAEASYAVDLMIADPGAEKFYTSNGGHPLAEQVTSVLLKDFPRHNDGLRKEFIRWLEVMITVVKKLSEENLQRDGIYNYISDITLVRYDELRVKKDN